MSGCVESSQPWVFVDFLKVGRVKDRQGTAF